MPSMPSSVGPTAPRPAATSRADAPADPADSADPTAPASSVEAAAARPTDPADVPGVELRRVAANGTVLNVALAGQGPAVLLLHGFPHTWRLWSRVIGALAPHHRVIAPDLRGFGHSDRPAQGYDAGTLAADAEALLGELAVPDAAVVGIDLGTPPAFLLALKRPDLVRRLVVMESLLGQLPGAEGFLAGGPPWWFGFHAESDLAASVTAGHAREYVDWFLDRGTRGTGAEPAIRAAMARTYEEAGALRTAFAPYAELPTGARQIAQAVTAARLTVPAMAIGAHPVGRALEHQLRPYADDMTGHVIPDCGHIIPLDRPDALLALLVPFLAAGHADQAEHVDRAVPAGRADRP